jgi:hypothetical protein
MADVAAALSGPVRDWLASQRPALNGRFRQAQWRFPALAPDAVLALCRELLPPLAGTDGAVSVELLSGVFDLILLHAGRGLLAPGGGTTGVGVLLRETFPALRPLLAARPRHLPGALSNAVENLGSRGIAFARGMTSLAHHLRGPEEVIDAGAVLAWRLGDARLRGAALERADRLPAPAVLAILGVPDWPAEAAPLLLAGLRADGWRRPEEMLSPQTRDGLDGAEPGRLDQLRQELSAPPAGMPAAWQLAGRLGNFVGFDGRFERPPLLLDAPAEASAHRFWVQSAEATYRIDADVFGWVCEAGALADAPVGQAKCPPQVKLSERTTSLVLRPGAVAYTTADSFRVRILVPARKPL